MGENLKKNSICIVAKYLPSNIEYKGKTSDLKWKSLRHHLNQMIETDFTGVKAQ